MQKFPHVTHAPRIGRRTFLILGFCDNRQLQGYNPLPPLNAKLRSDLNHRRDINPYRIAIASIAVIPVIMMTIDKDWQNTTRQRKPNAKNRNNQ